MSVSKPVVAPDEPSARTSWDEVFDMRQRCCRLAEELERRGINPGPAKLAQVSLHKVACQLMAKDRARASKE